MSTNSGSYLFKILSGALNGIEFSLENHAYFMCVGDLETDHDGVANNVELGQRTLYLPTTTASPNFILQLGESENQEVFQVTVNHPERQEIRTFHFNTVCQVGSVYFALKQLQDEWSEEVIKGILSETITLAAPEVGVRLVGAEKSSVGFRSHDLGSLPNRKKWGYKMLLALCLLLLGIGTAAAWLDFRKMPRSSYSQLQRSMEENDNFVVQQGRDHVLYLFVPDSHQANWARQVIARANSSESWRVVTAEDETKRLSPVLDQHHIAYFTMRFTDPLNPVLVMSRDRNAINEVSLNQIRQWLMDDLPYAEKIHIDLQDDEVIVKQASDGLQALGFQVSSTQSESGVTLQIPATMNDNELIQYGQFVEQFHRYWGGRYVHFSAELHDDAFKHNSFKYGQDGYINIGKSHWLFGEQ